MKKLIAITLCFVFAAAVFSGCRGNVNEDGTEMTGGDSRRMEPTTHMTVPSMPSEPTTGYANPSAPATDGGNGSTHGGAGSANGGSAGSANGGSGSTNGGTGMGGADSAGGSGSTMGRG